MDQDQDETSGFVPQNGCGLLGLLQSKPISPGRGQVEKEQTPGRPAPDLEKWQETNTHWTDYIGRPWVYATER
jgi:hypothetical protein